MNLKTMKSDPDIRHAVQNELEWDPRVDSTSIDVRVQNGLVTLTGAVDAYAKKVAACAAVHRVVGVLDVVDELQVKPPGQLRTDQDLAQAVRAALIWDVYVPDERITSTVSAGWVTLAGDVDQWHQREDAGRAVERLAGVRGVTNRIALRMKPAVDPAKLRDSIEAALARRAEREARRIEIKVEGDHVRLNGCVHSWAERNAVERLVAYSPGVRHIQNDVVVDPYS